MRVALAHSRRRTYLRTERVQARSRLFSRDEFGLRVSPTYGNRGTDLEESRLSDVARQFANVFAAIFQIFASYTVGSAVGSIAQEYRSLILPAPYAFAIWGPIFILCGFYALH
jgi:hypothetical protein